MSSSRLKWGAIGVLSLAHLMNDMCTNFLPQLIPFLSITRGLSVAAGTALVSAFSITSSIAQPVFGYLVDQKGQRWLVFVGTFWMAALLGVTGLAPNYSLLFAASALAGLGTAAFHPQAAAMVGQMGENRKGFVLAAFTAMGNVGLAVSPLFLLPLFHYYGTGSTWVIVIPGVFTALLLYWFAPRPESAPTKGPGLAQVLAALKKASRELNKLILIVAVRSLVYSGLTTLLPFYLLARKFAPEKIGYIMFATMAAGAVGGILGGYISDYCGRKPLIVGSLALAPAFFYGFLCTTGALSFILLIIGGGILLSSFSITVAAAQEIIPENRAMASALSMGFAIGLGGLAVSLVGKYADLAGVEAALHLVFLLPLVASLIGLSLKEGVSINSLQISS